MTDLELGVRLAVAGLAGLAVGLEREWSGHATGPGARFAGVRTFFLLGAIGGVAGWLSVDGPVALAVALLAVAGLFVVAAYVMAARRTPDDVDGTTEAAAILVLAVGCLAGRGAVPTASGMAAVMVLALGEKDAIRRFVARIDALEMRAALQFAVLALVVLPLLPTGPFGPYDAIRPRMIWGVVLLFSAVNFAGYLARRSLGDHRGNFVAGALGGLISSTAVTLAFARSSRRHPDRASSLARGSLIACTVLVPRVLAITLGLNPRWAPRAALALAPIFLGGLLMSLRGRGQADPVEEIAESPARNPLELGQAIRMALAFQSVVLAIEYAKDWFGDLGVVAGAAVAGLTDVDALTLGMARIASVETEMILATTGLIVGVIANTVLKTALGAWFGSPEFRRQLVPGMVVIALSGVVGLMIAT